MKLVQVEKEAMVTEARLEELKAGVVAKTITKGAAIRELFVGGWEVKDIASLLGIRYNHAYNVIKNEVLIHGLEVETESRNGENSKKAKIVSLLQEGKSITEVSAELKCLYNYVWQVAKAAGLTNKQVEAVKEQVQAKAKEAKTEAKAEAKGKKKVEVKVG